MAELKERYSAVAGVRTHFFQGGEGKELLFIHGLGGSTISWKYNLPALAEHFRVFAMDLPGHGGSEKPRAIPTLEYAREFILAFMDSQGIEKASLIGNSVGGLIALEAGLKAPHQVEGLVVVDGAGLGKDVDFALRLLAFPLLGKVMAKPSRTGTRVLLKRIFANPHLATEELVEEIYLSRKKSRVNETIVRIMKNEMGLSGVRPSSLILDRLPQLRVPTLIVWGAQDKLTPLSHGEAAMKLIPGARLHIFQDCGHWPQMERAEEFNRLVTSFLKRDT